MTRWLDHVHDYAQDIVNEVYFKISQDGSTDPMQKWTSAIMDVTMAVLADVDFPGAAITGYAFQGIIGSFSEDTPDPLNKKFGDVWSRFSATFQTTDTYLATFQGDPEGNWNKSFTNPFTGQTFTVSSLGDPNVFFPTNDPELQNTSYYDPVSFDAAFDKALVAFKYNLARNVLGMKWSILHQPNHTFWSGWNDDDARRFAKDQINGNRDVFLTWWPDQEGSCAGCPSDGMSTSEPRIGVGEWYSNWDYYHGERASKDMCDWLMQDDGFGTVLNPSAITTRHDVFYNWPLEGNLGDHPDHSTFKRGVTKNVVSEETKNQARAWQKLLRQQGRKEIDEELIQRATDDPKFRADLIRNPKQAIEAHFGLPIPDEVKISVEQEKAGSYKLVLPYFGAPKRS